MWRSTNPWAVAVALALAGALAGCSTAAPRPTENTGGNPQTTPVTQTPAPTPEPSVPEIDEFSQEVAGVVYEGTEAAPVRIGQDTPGQPPAAEAQMVRENSEQLAQDAGKYLVYVSDAEAGGFQWKLFGMSRHGSFRELARYGYGSEPTFATSEAAAAGPFVLDGRPLDRSEYLLFVD